MLALAVPLIPVQFCGAVLTLGGLVSVAAVLLLLPAAGAASMDIGRRPGTRQRLTLKPGLIRSSFHSLRSATIGSTLVARRAGRNEARIPTRMITPETLPKVTKSVAVTP